MISTTFGSLIYLTITQPDFNYLIDLLIQFMQTPCNMDWFLGSGAISWSSKKQPRIALLSTKAEYRGAIIVACEAVWFKRILKDLGISIKDPILLHYDNLSTIHLARNLVFHARTRTPKCIITSFKNVSSRRCWPSTYWHEFLDYWHLHKRLRSSSFGNSRRILIFQPLTCLDVGGVSLSRKRNELAPSSTPSSRSWTKFRYGARWSWTNKGNRVRQLSKPNRTQKLSKPDLARRKPTFQQLEVELEGARWESNSISLVCEHPTTL